MRIDNGESKYYRVEAMSGMGYVLQNLAETLEEAEAQLEKVIEEFGSELDNARIIKIFKRVDVISDEFINSSGSALEL